jgi:NAD(P)-dependent dehydrogenase (short-subunit alcohol dehydrogenase family)
MRILITGGCGHIGREIVKYFSAHYHPLHGTGQANLVYVCGTDEEKFKNLSFNNNVKFIKHDFNKDSDLKEKLNKINIRNIDVLINNAYFIKPSTPLNNTLDNFMYGLKGTVGIYYETIKECYPFLLEKSKIINIGSMYGNIIPDFEMYPTEEEINPIEYGVGKSGVSHLTKYLANYLAPKNINVNCILPGSIPSNESLKNKRLMEGIIKRTPLKRLGKPEDLLGIISLLSTTSGDFITGQCISVDGGFSNK